MEEKTSEVPGCDCNGPETNTTVFTSKSAKKKTKKKKLKNTVHLTQELPQQQDKQTNSVNSLSGKLNGIVGDSNDNLVEMVANKLENTLSLSNSGTINGTLPGSEHEVAKLENTPAITKRKHRSKQKSKPPASFAQESDAGSAQFIGPSAASDTSERNVKVSANEHVVTVPDEPPKPHITYQVYESELQMPNIMSIIQKDLSEPYSIYTYRYFIHNWPRLCFLALHEERCVGAIVCKLDIHRQNIRRGYIAMLAVDKDYRKLKIGTTLVQKAIQAMREDNADEVVLETEITNRPALQLYENLGFVRDKRLFHYYLNGVDALRLKLWFR